MFLYGERTKKEALSLRLLSSAMRKKGLEPSRRKPPLEPESSSSANSDTSAYINCCAVLITRQQQYLFYTIIVNLSTLKFKKM